MRFDKLAVAVLGACLCGGISVSHILLERSFISPWTLSAISFVVCLTLALGCKYLKTNKIYCPAIAFFMLGVVSTAESCLAPTQGIDRILASWMQGPGDFLERLIEEHFARSDLLKALLLGRRDGLSGEIKTAFRDCGASHLLALSGMHLGIIYMVVDKIVPLRNGTSIVWRAVRSAIILSACSAYAMMAGLSPSLQRAVVFIIVREVSRLSFSHTSPLRCLCSAAFIQLCFINPNELFTVGFQLSYLAVLGLISFNPILSEWFPKDPLGRFFPGLAKKIWDVCALSLSCQIFTAPVVLLYFGTVSGRFLLTNLIAIPLTTVLIAGGLLVLGLIILMRDADLSLFTDAIDMLCDALVGLVSLLAD